MNTLFLAGIELNPQMVWVDRTKSQAVAQTVLTTLGGNPVIYSQALVAGKSITLEAQENRGWLRGTQVDALLLIGDQVGAVFDLQINGVTQQVVLRHQDPPALDFQPIVPRLNRGENDRYTGTIKLMTV